jgi:hypothetical protein
MKNYSGTAVERTMKIQEVLLQAMAKKITWWQATEIIGISDRSMRRERYEQHGYDGLLDRRRGKPSPMRVPLQRAARVPLALPTVAYQIWTMDFTQDALASGRKFRPRSEMANTSSRP